MNFFDSGENYYINEEYNNAYNEFQESINANEGNENDALNYLGCCLIALGKFDEAINTFDKIIKCNPTWERPFFNKGRVYLKLKNYSQALAMFNRAMMLNSEDEDVYFYLGRFFEEQNEFIKAKEYYEKSLKINYDQPETHLNLGIVFFRIADYKNAIKEFESASKDEYLYIDSTINKGKALCELKKYGEALKVFLQIYVEDRKDVELMYDIAATYYKLHEFEKSRFWIKKALVLEPDYEEAKLLEKTISIPD